MTIVAKCPCGQLYSASAESIGESMVCGKCNQTFVIDHQTGGEQAIQTTPVNLPTATPVGYQLPNRYAQPDLLAPQPTQVQTSIPGTGSQPIRSASSPGSAGFARQPQPNVGKGVGVILLMVGLAALGATMVVVLLVWLLFSGGTSASGIDLTYLPEEVVQVDHVKVAEILETKAGQDFLDGNKLFASQLRSAALTTGIELSKIESVTIGYGNAEIGEEAFEFGNNRKTMDVLSAFSRVFNFCGVIRLSQDVDQSKVLAYASRISEENFEGETYYKVRLSPQLSTEPGAVAFPEPNIILFGTELEVKNALAGSRAKNKRFFSGVEASDQIVVLNGRIDFPQKLERMGAAARFGDAIDYRVWLDCESSTDAAQIQASINSFNSMAGTFGNSMMQRFPANSGPMFGGITGGMEADVSGNTVTFRKNGTASDPLIRSFLAGVIYSMIPRFGRINRNAWENVNQGTNSAKTNPRPKGNAPGKFAFPKKKKPEPTTKEILAKLPVKRPGNGTRLNLLELIQLEKDVVKGNWEFQNGNLVGTSRSFTPRIQIPYHFPSEFDFEVVFQQSKPNGRVCMVVPGSPQPYAWVLNHPFHKNLLTFNPIRKNPAAIEIKNLVQPNTRHRMTVQVRKDSIRGCFDDRVLVELKSDFDQLKPDIRSRLKNPKLAGFACDAETTIFELSLVEVSGSGSFAE